ncbi:hypothetical protein [Streptomyces sp. DH12]|uniref:hypothetical protein n=1 Tax=Streptomyces sp. DH12 TaxID=2857010 RepID=UPI001E41D7F7|nr:hypothetical protein [Streptomyces sp. DH12]
MSGETPGTPVGHEAYAFACMRCGYGWEQAYDIEHHTDVTGHDVAVYRSEGRRVPSPLSHPTCPNCGRHVVRIMRSGRISTVLDHGEPRPGVPGMAPRRAAVPVATTGPLGQEMEERPLPRATAAGRPATDPSAGPPADAGGVGPAGGPEGGQAGPRHRRLAHLLHPFHRQ